MARVVRGIGLFAAFVVGVGLVAWGWLAASIPLVMMIAAGVAILALALSRLLTKRVKSGTVIELDLDSGLIEGRGADPVSQLRHRGTATILETVEALAKAREDPRVTGLIARVGNGQLQVAHAQELRDAIRAFGAAHKTTVAFSESFGESANATIDYYVATAFQSIVLMPKATTSVHGLIGRGRFVRGLLDKLGVVPDMGNRREYKAAMYMLTESSFNEAHRESVSTLTAELFDQILRGIAEDRSMPIEEVRAAIDLSPLNTDDALRFGLVDRLGYRDEAYELAGGKHHIFANAYLKKTGRMHKKGPRIGLVHGSGAIYRGSSGIDPLSGGSSMGADDIARAFRQATADDKLRAIVFRVDTPGGSAVGSEIIRREISRAQDAGKPVIVSMGNVAASGGYWISANADAIIAQPGTVTGSIGVVSGKLATREAWSKAGITFDHIAYGEHATYSLSYDSYSESERERLEVSLDTIYEDFIDLVTTGRGVDNVEDIAKGRVWAGAQAKEIGLVDELGGFDRAIEVAKRKADIEPESEIKLVPYPVKERRFPPVRRENSEPVGDLAATIQNLLLHLRPGDVQLRMPDFSIE